MGFKWGIARIRELVKEGYLSEAFSEIMNNRMRYNEWSFNFKVQYLIDQLGCENISTLYESIPFLNQRCLSERRLEVLEAAYKRLEKHIKIKKLVEQSNE